MNKFLSNKFFYFALGAVSAWLLPRLRFTTVKKTRTYDLYLKDQKSQSFLSTLIFSPDEDVYKTLFHDLQSLPDDKDITIFVETFGGSSLWVELICNKIKTRKGKVSVYINSYGLSAGTCVALAADELHMTTDAVLSAIDPQESVFRHLYLPIKDIASLIKNFKESSIEIYDKRRNMALIKTKELLNDKYNDEQKNLIVSKMFQEPVDHSTLFFVDQLKEIGIDILPFDE